MHDKLHEADPMALPRDGLEPTEWLSTSEAEAVFQNPVTLRRLFPEGVIAINNNWLPFKTTQRNMRKVSRLAQFLVSREAGEITSISHCDVMPNPGGDLFAMYFHGEKMSHLFAHISRHLCRMREFCNQQRDTYFGIIYPESTGFSSLQAALQNAFGDYLPLRIREVLCAYSVDIQKLKAKSKL